MQAAPQSGVDKIGGAGIALSVDPQTIARVTSVAVTPDITCERQAAVYVYIVVDCGYLACLGSNQTRSCVFIMVVGQLSCSNGPRC